MKRQSTDGDGKTRAEVAGEGTKGPDRVETDRSSCPSSLAHQEALIGIEVGLHDLRGGGRRLPGAWAGGGVRFTGLDGSDEPLAGGTPTGSGGQRGAGNKREDATSKRQARRRPSEPVHSRGHRG